MILFNSFRAAIGLLKFEQITPKDSHPVIRISGINTFLLEKDLRKIFSTSKVYSSMFDRIDKYALEFPSFFALEVERIMQRIIGSPDRLNTSRRTARLIVEGLYEYTWLKKTQEQNYPKRLDQSMIKNFQLKPLDYQQAFIDMFDRVTYQYSLNGILLDAIMGSGKTITSLYIAECSRRDIKIVVCPKNAVDQVWIKTLQEKIDRPIKLWSTTSVKPYANEEYLIVHYEGLKKALDIVKNIRGKTFALIIDECHNFAEIKSQQTQNLINLQKEIKSDILIPQSGTTFKAIGSEIVAMMHLLDPTFSEEIGKRFSKMYGAAAVEALDLLKHRIGLITHKVTKDQVGLGDPIIQNFTVSSPLAKNYTLVAIKQKMKEFVESRIVYYKSRQEKDERVYKNSLDEYESQLKTNHEIAEFHRYKQAVANIRARDAIDCSKDIVFSNAFEKSFIIPRLPKYMVENFKEAKTIYKYVRLKINGECLGQVLSRMRKECAMEIAKSVNYTTFIESTEKKTLVYTVYIDTLKTIEQTLQSNNYKTLAVYGETNKDLNNIINRFEKTEELNPLIATFKSLSTAIPMTMADCMIMIDTPFRDYIFQQTIARINRLGATTQTYVYIASLDTGSEPNISNRTLDILKWSQSQIEAITGVKSPFEITDEQFSMEGIMEPITAFEADTNPEYHYMRKLA